MVVLGGALAIYMTIAMIHEIMADDAYGIDSGIPDLYGWNHSEMPGFRNQ